MDLVQLENKKNGIDKPRKIIYNINNYSNKDIFGVSKKSKQHTEKNNPIKVTRNYTNNTPTQDEIHKMQNEVQRILLPNINKDI